MTLRWITHGSKGYTMLRVGQESHDAGVGPRFVSMHRLAAVAWGVLDGLDDEREVDHQHPVPWYNAETNFQAVHPDDHGRLTRERAAARTARADGGHTQDASASGE